MGRYKIKLLSSRSYMRKSASSIGIIPAKISGLKGVEIGVERLADLKNIRPLNEKKIAQFAQRMKKGDRCFCAELNGELVSFMWLRGYGQSYYSAISRRSFPIQSDELWFFDVYTAASSRGNGIVPWMYTTVMSMYREKIKKFFVDVETTNIASIRSIEKSGFEQQKNHFVLMFGSKAIRFS